MSGNRSIYHDGWLAAANHWTFWNSKRPPLSQDRWELYHVARDYSQATDLAARFPGKLDQMKRLFESEAVKYSVYPIEDRLEERLVAEGRPGILANTDTVTLTSGTPGLTMEAFMEILNRPFRITADIVVPENGNGVLFAIGGRIGGWSLYLHDGVPKFVYNFVGMEHYGIVAKQQLKPGPAKVMFDFSYDGGRGGGGIGRLLVYGQELASGRIAKTEALLLAGPETADVGIDRASPVTDDYGAVDNRFNGTINSVKIDIGHAGEAGSVRKP